MKNKQIIKKSSSEIVADFLEKNSLHKKDFAEMIGVTLSYVYNLIDNSMPFSTRGTTLERIATVMGVEPEIFEEYSIPQEPILIDDDILFIRDVIKDNKLSIVNFLKSFPRKKRIDMVDMLRGALPIPSDYKELLVIGQILNIPKEDIFSMWEKRVRQLFESGGVNLSSNSLMIDAMFDCAKKLL